MLDTIDHSTIDTLIDWETPPCVTILMPTHRSGPGTRQGPIRLGNLVQRARADLAGLTDRTSEVNALLADVAALSDDHDFWAHQEDGLAIHVAEDFIRTTRLATPLDETVIVSDAFHLKPLFHAVQGDDRFHLLALSRGEVRLLWGRRHRVGEVAIDGIIPDGLAAALWFEDREKQLQHRSGSRNGRGGVVAVFHGHESSDDERDRAFLRAVDEGVMELVDPDVPLVLAGVTEITALFASITRHPTVLDSTVAGSPDDSTPQELHAAAWSLVEPVATKSLRSDATRFEESPGSRLTDPIEILRAANVGRLETVWVPLNHQLWGAAAADGVEIHDDQRPGDRDLTDVAAISTHTRGGRVHVVESSEVPGAGAMAAVARYRA